MAKTATASAAAVATRAMVVRTGHAEDRTGKPGTVQDSSTSPACGAPSIATQQARRAP
jgi:hypothetical protein